MVRESCRYRGEFGVATVGVPTCVAGVRTQVLIAAPTVLAYPAGVPQPCDPDPVADVELVTRIGADLDNLRDDLVSGCHLLPVHGKVAFGDVQIGAAHSARPHRDQEL